MRECCKSRGASRLDGQHRERAHYIGDRIAPSCRAAASFNLVVKQWRSRSAPQIARRARIILKCAEGVDNKTVAHKLRVTPQMVGKWRARFVGRRLEGLHDEPRPGAPRHVDDGQVEAVVVRTLEFRKFLDHVEANMPADLDIHVIVDNYGTHKTALIRNWFAKRPRFHAHFTPTYGSWLDLVERWFAERTNKQLRRGSHRSVRELERAIQEFLDTHNEKPRPFIWTKTADQIPGQHRPLRSPNVRNPGAINY